MLKGYILVLSRFGMELVAASSVLFVAPMMIALLPRSTQRSVIVARFLMLLPSNPARAPWFLVCPAQKHPPGCLFLPFTPPEAKRDAQMAVAKGDTDLMELMKVSSAQRVRTSPRPTTTAEVTARGPTPNAPNDVGARRQTNVPTHRSNAIDVAVRRQTNTQSPRGSFPTSFRKFKQSEKPEGSWFAQPEGGVGSPR